MNTAIDRGQLVQAAYYGQAVPAGPLSPALTSWALPTSQFPCYHTDPARAVALLKQAGLTLPVKITINVLGSLQQVVDVAQVLQAQLNAGRDLRRRAERAGAGAIHRGLAGGEFPGLCEPQ